MSSTSLKLVKGTVNRRCAGDRAQRFRVAGGVAELEAKAEMRLGTSQLGAEEVRVLRALLRRPLVAARLVHLGLR